MQERIVARLAGELGAADRDELERHLEHCPACSEHAASTERLWAELGEEPVPSEPMRRRFDAWIAREARVGRLDRYRRLERFLPLAAALVLGVGAGYFWGAGEQREVTALRGEVAALHATVAESLLGQASESKRLRGVAYARELPTDDPAVVDALIHALREDESVNVRLAAVEALGALVGGTPRQADLVGAIAVQSSPLVQLSLIEALLESDAAGSDPSVSIRERLQSLVDDPRLDLPVRAYLRDRLLRSV
jgi:hypothetical protein